MTTYERIKQLRIQKGLTQQALAEKIGYKSSTAITKIEAGERDINRSKIVDLASALDTTPAYLMGWDDNPESKSLNEQIVELMDDLTDEQKNAIIEFVKQMTK